MSHLLLLVVLRTCLAGDDPGWSELADAGSWSAIEEAAHVALAADPDDGDALYWLGRAEATQLAGLGGGAFAAGVAERLAESASEHLGRAADSGSRWAADAAEWQGLLAWDLGLPLDTATLERRADRGWAGSAYVRGLLAFDAGEPETAATWLERAAAAAPGRGDVRLGLADVLSALGRRDDALAAWASAVDGAFPALVSRDALPEVLARVLPGAANAAARLGMLDRLAARPEWTDDAWLAWYRAFALEELGRLADALAAFAAGTRGRTAEIDRAHARALSLNDRPLEAVGLLRPLAEGRDWEAYSDLVSVGDRLGQQRRFDEAVAVYDQALAIEPRDERALRNRALTLWRAGRASESAVAWDALCERFPGRSDLLNDAALAALARGDAPRALELLDMAVELPGSIDARENLARLLLDRASGPAAPEARARARGLVDAVLFEEPARPRALLLRLQLADASL